MNYKISLLQLDYFCTVVTSSSIHEAAQKLHIAQPSLSIAIKNLEEEIGITLFDRHNRRLTLTAEGNSFYREAKQLLAHANAVDERIQLLKEGRQKIKLGIAPMMSSFLFPVIFKHFALTHPEVEFEIQEYGVLRLQAMLNSQDLDLAFLIDTGKLQDKLDFHPLLKTKYHLYVGPENELVKKVQHKKDHYLTIMDYKDTPMIFYRETSYIQTQITKHFQEHQINPNILLRTNQIHTIKELAGDSLAAAFLTEKAVSPKDNLVLIHTDHSFPIEIGLAQNKESHSTQAIRD